MRFFLGSIFTTVRERFYDNFTRGDRSDLGTASDNSIWQTIRSGIGISGNKASATNPAAYPISVQNMPSTNATVTLKNVAAGSGAALWVQSSDDWVTVSVEREDRAVPSTAYTTNAAYNYTQYVTGYTTAGTAPGYNYVAIPGNAFSGNALLGYNYVEIPGNAFSGNALLGYNYVEIPGNAFSGNALLGYNIEQNAVTYVSYATYGPTYGTNAGTTGYNTYNFQYTTTSYGNTLKFSTYYAFYTAYGNYLANAANYGNVRAYGNFYYKGVTGYYNFTQLYAYSVKYGAGVNYYYTTYSYLSTANGTNYGTYTTAGNNYFAGNALTSAGFYAVDGNFYSAPVYYAYSGVNASTYAVEPVYYAYSGVNASTYAVEPVYYAYSGVNATTYAVSGPNYYYQFFTYTPGFTQIALGSYQYTAFNAAYTANDQKVVIRQSTSGVINTIKTWLVSSTAIIRALRVKAIDGDVTVQAYSDANLVSQIGNDLVHTPTGITVDTRFGITLTPATNGQSNAIASEVSIDTE